MNFSDWQYVLLVAVILVIAKLCYAVGAWFKFRQLAKQRNIEYLEWLHDLADWIKFLPSNLLTEENYHNSAILVAADIFSKLGKFNKTASDFLYSVGEHEIALSSDLQELLSYSQDEDRAKQKIFAFTSQILYGARKSFCEDYFKTSDEMSRRKLFDLQSQLRIVKLWSSEKKISVFCAEYDQDDPLGIREKIVSFEKELAFRITQRTIRDALNNENYDPSLTPGDCYDVDRIIGELGFRFNDLEISESEYSRFMCLFQKADTT